MSNDEYDEEYWEFLEEMWEAERETIADILASTR